MANSQLADELDRYVSNFESIKKLLIEEKYNRVFDFVEFVLRHELTPTTLSKSVAQVFDDGMCAYTIIEDGRILSIVPVAIPEQRESIEKAFEALASDPFGGARSHLFKSAKCINSGDHAGSVRESIHAVESVARRLDTGSRKSLAPALAALSKKGVVLHGAFKSGIEKLYGYSSDVDGIRHSLLEKNAKVDVEDAVFMFGACASFARAARKVSQNAGRFLTHPSSAEGV